ncbi:MAG: histidine phosphatase family protein, partial [Bdellovibrionales bacterium]|nr:histidine phosphatase family protein [Bdellovibrionales bacterium]
VYSSEEPKALETAQIVSRVLQVSHRPLAELNEIDRRARPITSRELHIEYNRELFVRRQEKVVGDESAEEALDRFEFGINLILLGKPENVLVISHGTVISLYAQRHNSSLFAFGLWQKMACLDYLDLGLPDFNFQKLQDFGSKLDLSSNKGPQ